MNVILLTGGGRSLHQFSTRGHGAIRGPARAFGKCLAARGPTGAGA